ncbi:MAG: BlaI/MecI/CopY family transcriptional regulator [Oscillospiraceae bacterium]|nr:BlaI/MecI/CopY family transcriptional regulator [Oscillospiraceae bacterium]
MQQISAQEYQIMQAIWQSGEDGRVTTRDIEARLREHDGKSRNMSSLMTVIARLVDKGYIQPVKEFRHSTYFLPLILEAEYKTYATTEFVNNIHNGILSNLFTTLIGSGKYTKKDIDTLKAALDAEAKGR